MRIALFKYKLGGITDTVYSGLEKLVEEVLEQKFSVYNWMGWRETKLWTMEIDDLYRSNLLAM